MHYRGQSPLTAPPESEVLPIGNTYIYMSNRKISEKLIHTFELKIIRQESQDGVDSIKFHATMVLISILNLVYPS
jgi:hypothetical protein